MTIHCMHERLLRVYHPNDYFVPQMRPFVHPCRDSPSLESGSKTHREHDFARRVTGAILCDGVLDHLVI